MQLISKRLTYKGPFVNVIVRWCGFFSLYSINFSMGKLNISNKENRTTKLVVAITDLEGFPKLSLLLLCRLRYLRRDIMQPSSQDPTNPTGQSSSFFPLNRETILSYEEALFGQTSFAVKNVILDMRNKS